MIRHGIRVGLRNLFKRKGVALLNLLGLTLGMTSFMVISLYVLQETRYEQGFTNANRTYRIVTDFLNADVFASSSYNARSVLAEQPEFEYVTQLSRVYGKSAEIAGTEFGLTDYFFADSLFNRVFDYELSQGVFSSAFKNENSLILTEAEAVRLFGSTEVVGKSINVGSEKLEVTAVLKPTSWKTHLEFNGLWIKPPKPHKSDHWASIDQFTYASTFPEISTEQIQDRLDYVSEHSIFPGLAEILGFKSNYTYEDWKKSGSDVSLLAQPIASIHLNSNLAGEMSKGGSAQTVFTFSLIAAFILLISCANFVNLSTARASERGKELGIKKVLGTTRGTLVRQVLLESVFLSLIAGMLSLALTELSLQLFRIYFPEFITLSLFNSLIVLGLMLGTVLFVGLASGSYPAWYLSSFKITSLLKGQKARGFSGEGFARFFRNGLVTLQFTMSAVLIIGALLVASQLNYMSKIDLGFEDQDVLVVTNGIELGDDLPAFQRELENLAFVENTASMLRFPGEVLNNIKVNHKLENGVEAQFEWFQGDDGLFETLGLELADGRFFSQEIPSDKENSILINETAARLYGNTPVLGSKLDGKTVVGVVRDFHFESLRAPIRPLVFKLVEPKGRLAIKMPVNQENIARVEAEWSTISNRPFKYQLLSENYEEMLNAEAQTGRAFGIFTILAIFISCLGMYGLALYATDQRAKEMSIRKILGASSQQIFKLLATQFFRPVVLALVMAIPVSFWAVKYWLSDFAYRVDISGSHFFVGVILVAILVLLTISRQSYLTASKNPAETLKTE